MEQRKQLKLFITNHRIMKHFVNYKTLKALLYIMFAFITITVNAQGDPGGPGGDPDASVPIDGGLSLALAAGAGYIVKRKHDARNKKSKEILP
jgi:hypothetical protein